MLKDVSPPKTVHLDDWIPRDEEALEQLMPLVYDELRRMARGFLKRQPSHHTLQTTELIHEAYLKIAKGDKKNWQNRAHFFGVAATAMRHILVDYARSKHRQKRGGVQERVSLSDGIAVSRDQTSELIDLDEVMNALEVLDARKSRVVELRFFGGLTNEEIAEVLKISVDTVKRDWRFARTWLLREMEVAD